MKKAAFLLASVFCLTLVSCSNETDTTEKKESSKEQKEENASEKKEVGSNEETTNYEPFTKEKLQGEWEVIDAVAYSKDKMIGETYVFDRDSATYYAGFGNKGMVKGTVEIKDDKLSLVYKNKHENGTSTVTSTYEGGFEGDLLYLSKSPERITLKRK